MFSFIHFNNLLGVTAKRANVNRKVRKLGNITWGISSDIPQFWLHHVTCLDQSRARKIFVDYNSGYPESAEFYDKTNKKVIGKFKDEASFVPILEFIGLRSKMYSYMKENQHCCKTAKGIKRNVIKQTITYENYKETLFNNKQMHHKMRTIRSHNHELGSYEINKISLSSFDDKRYILKDGIASYAYGHHNIKHYMI